jgi:hypothetical protein
MPQQSPIPHLSLRQMHTQSRRHNIIGDRSNNRVRLRETFSSLDAHDSSASCSARLWKVTVCELDNCSCSRVVRFRLSVTGSRQRCSSRGRVHRRYLHLSRRQHVLLRNRPHSRRPGVSRPVGGFNGPCINRLCQTPSTQACCAYFFRPKATKWKKRRNYIRNTGRAGPLSAHIKK